MRLFGCVALDAEMNDTEDAERNNTTTLPSVAGFRQNNLARFPKRAGFRELRFDSATVNCMTTLRCAAGLRRLDKLNALSARNIAQLANLCIASLRPPLRS
jgi:hypothetical protein